MRCVIFAILLLVVLSACQRRQQVDAVKLMSIDTLTNTDREFEERIERERVLSNLLVNAVDVDSFIKTIVPQQKVLTLSVESSSNSDTTWLVKPNGDRLFVSQYLLETDGKDRASTVVSVSGREFNFDDFSVTCYNDTIHCGYAYNWLSSINNIRLIEVCGKQFLYALVDNNCNGNGCLVQTYMVYDIQTNTPTFIQSYNLEFDGYLLSDFNADGNPDLLLVEDANSNYNAAFGVYDFTAILTAYTYSRGKFVPLAYRDNKPAFITLYGIGEYDRRYASVTETNWFK